MNGINWGDAPTWLGVAFAGAAATAAIRTMRNQQTQLEEQRRFIGEQSEVLTLQGAELRASAEERRRGQSKRIAVSLEFRRASEGGAIWVVDVVNGSDEPIREVDVRFGTAHHAAFVSEVSAVHLPDGGRRARPLHLLGGGRAAQFMSSLWQEATAENNRPVVSFRDAAGYRWSIDHNGVVTELLADVPAE
ncbi:hypothetical protein [Streptomyces uncialis]|uniref:hypothetical protein n=1 Tax=Streptomyces uncialis TaxID=1048205 RepID=UPI0037881D5B